MFGGATPKHSNSPMFGGATPKHQSLGMESLGILATKRLFWRDWNRVVDRLLHSLLLKEIAHNITLHHF
jgi:hypothetical protein